MSLSVFYPCHTCPKQRPVVQPTGPVPCPVLLLGECPHRDEDKFGIPFSGRTGKELDSTYLPLARLPRSRVYVANAVLCSRPDYSNPDPADAFNCMSRHLGTILRQVQPVIVVPMGAIACSLWPEINVNTDHGLPRPGKWGSWKGVLFSTYHPSIGMHQTSFMIALMKDFKALGELVRELGVEVC